MSANPVWCLQSISTFKNTQRKQRKQNKVFFPEDAFYLGLVQLLPDISPILDPVCYRYLPLIDGLIVLVCILGWPRTYYVGQARLELTAS